MATEAVGATATSGVTAGVCWDPSLAAHRVGTALSPSSLRRYTPGDEPWLGQEASPNPTLLTLNDKRKSIAAEEYTDV